MECIGSTVGSDLLPVAPFSTPERAGRFNFSTEGAAAGDARGLKYPAALEQGLAHPGEERGRSGLGPLESLPGPIVPFTPVIEPVGPAAVLALRAVGRVGIDQGDKPVGHGLWGPENVALDDVVVPVVPSAANLERPVLLVKRNSPFS